MLVVVVCVDELSLRHLGAYGNLWAETPVLDRLAASGCCADGFYTPVPTLSLRALTFPELADSMRQGFISLAPEIAVEQTVMQGPVRLPALVAWLSHHSARARPETTPPTTNSTKEEPRAVGRLLWIDYPLPPLKAAATLAAEALQAQAALEASGDALASSSRHLFPPEDASDEEAPSSNEDASPEEEPPAAEDKESLADALADDEEGLFLPGITREVPREAPARSAGKRGRRPQKSKRERDAERAGGKAPGGPRGRRGAKGDEEEDEAAELDWDFSLAHPSRQAGRLASLEKWLAPLLRQLEKHAGRAQTGASRAPEAAPADNFPPTAAEPRWLLLVTANQGCQPTSNTPAALLAEERLHLPLWAVGTGIEPGSRLAGLVQPADLRGVLTRFFHPLRLAEGWLPATVAAGQALAATIPLDALREASLREAPPPSEAAPAEETTPERVATLPERVFVASAGTGLYCLQTSDAKLIVGSGGASAEARTRQLFLKPEDRWEVNDMAARLDDQADELEARLWDLVNGQAPGGIREQ